MEVGSGPPGHLHCQVEMDSDTQDNKTVRQRWVVVLRMTKLSSRS